MEFIDEDELEKEIEAQSKTIADEIAEAKANSKTDIKEETYLDKHMAYLSLPFEVVWHLIHCCFSDKENYVAARSCFKEGNLSKISSAFKAETSSKLTAEQLNLPLKWIEKRIRAGWRSGKLCTSVSGLNKLAAFNAQLEFIPVRVDNANHFICHKVRFNACPYLPVKVCTRPVDMLYRFNGKTMEPRTLPLNLHAAFQKQGKKWEAALTAALYVKRAHTVFPHIESSAQLATILGNQNYDKLVSLHQGVDEKVADFIEVLPNQKSIFSGKVLDQWSNFFSGFATDEFGPVSPARALASLDYDVYYGELSEVAIWKPIPVVLKVKGRLESIVDHTYVDYYSTHVWPAGAMCYNLDPADLNAYIVGAGTPAALAMPITACFSKSPQIDTYCRRVSTVKITVLFASTPVVVFSKDNVGLSGASIKEAITVLERVFVKGYIIASKNNSSRGFTITPAQDYSPDKLSVKITVLTNPFNHVSTRYMSMTKKEKSRYIPTARVQDVYVGGDKLGNEEVLGTFVPTYPRASPTLIPRDELIIKGIYDDDGEYVGQGDIDLEDWAPKRKPEDVNKPPRPDHVPANKTAEKAAPEPKPPAEEKAAEPMEEENVEAEPAHVPPAAAEPAPEPQPMEVNKPGEAYEEAEKRNADLDAFSKYKPVKVWFYKDLKTKVSYTARGFYDEKNKLYYRSPGVLIRHVHKHVQL